MRRANHVGSTKSPPTAATVSPPPGADPYLKPRRLALPATTEVIHERGRGRR
jgi:hypothetical protein